MQKSRKELEEVLLERIPMGKDEEQLRESLSKIRHEKTGEKIEKDVIDAFMGFLGSVYAVGNMTSAAVTSRGGALDNWDAKLKNIHEKYIKEEKAWVATVYKGNIIKNLIMDCQSYTKYRPNETTGGIFVSWRRKEELPTGA